MADHVLSAEDWALLRTYLLAGVRAHQTMLDLVPPTAAVEQNRHRRQLKRGLELARMLKVDGG